MSKRNEIIEIATELFSSKGYCATSLSAICEAVDLRKASVYHHFSSKEAVLKAVIKNNIALCRERIVSKLDESHKAFITAIYDNRELLVLSSIIAEIHSLPGDLIGPYINFWDDAFFIFLDRLKSDELPQHLHYSLASEFHGAIIIEKLRLFKSMKCFCDRLRGLLDE